MISSVSPMDPTRVVYLDPTRGVHSFLCTQTALQLTLMHMGSPPKRIFKKSPWSYHSSYCLLLRPVYFLDMENKDAIHIWKVQKKKKVLTKKADGSFSAVFMGKGYKYCKQYRSSINPYTTVVLCCLVWKFKIHSTYLQNMCYQNCAIRTLFLIYVTVIKFCFFLSTKNTDIWFVTQLYTGLVATIMLIKIKINQFINFGNYCFCFWWHP